MPNDLNAGPDNWAHWRGMDTMVQSPLNTWTPENPWEGMPGGPMVQLLGQMAGNTAMNSAGYQMMGWRQSGDVYSTLRRQMVTKEHMDAMSAAALYDVGLFAKFAAGTARSMGLDVDQEQLSTAGHKLFGGFMPYVDPRITDKLTGGTSYANMLHGAHVTGQLMVDPVTGFQGFSTNTAKQVARGIYEDLGYDIEDNDPEGRKNWKTKAHGLTTLEVRDLQSELTRRGMMPSAHMTERERVLAGLRAMESPGVQAAMEDQEVAGSRTTQDALKAAGLSEFTKIEDIDDEGIAKLAEDTGVQFGMRADVAGRVSKQLEKYTGAVEAVKELFGAQDAPMSELMNMLEGLTNNTLSQFSAQRVETTVRNLWGTAEQAGIGVQQLQAMFGVGNQLASAYGLQEAVVPGMVQTAAGFRGAYDATGAGAHPSWGMKSADELMQMKMGQYASATASAAANRMGMIARMGELYGGMGGDTAKMFQAIKSGHGAAYSAQLTKWSDAQLAQQIAADTGMSVGAVMEELRATNRNQEYGEMYQVGRQAMPMQVEEAVDKVLGSPVGRATAVMADRVSEMVGNRSKETISFAQQLSASQAQAVATLGTENPALFADSNVRLGALTASAKKFVEERAAAGDTTAQAMMRKAAESKDPEAYFRQMTQQHFQAGEEEFARFNNGQELVNFFRLNDPNVQARERQEFALLQARNAISASGKGKLTGDFVTRLIQSGRALAGEGATDEELQKGVGGILIEATGGRMTETLARDVTSGFLSIDKQQKALEAKKAELGALTVSTGDAKSPAVLRHKEMLEADIARQEKAIKQAGDELAAFVESNPEVKAAVEEQLKKEAEAKTKAEEAGTAGTSAGATFTGGIVFNDVTFTMPDGIKLEATKIASTGDPKGQVPGGTAVAQKA